MSGMKFTSKNMVNLSEAIDRVLNGEAKDDKRTIGFALITFEFNKDESDLKYVSSGDRTRIIKVLKQVAANLEASLN